MAWTWSSIHCLPQCMPNLKENKIVFQFLMSQIKPVYLRPLLSECFKEQRKEKRLRRIYIGMSEQLPVSLCVLCALGSILGFYVSAFYAYCICRLRLSCKDGIIWDSWLACGLLKFLCQTVWEESTRIHQFTSHIWHLCTRWRKQHKENTHTFCIDTHKMCECRGDYSCAELHLIYSDICSTTRH